MNSALWVSKTGLDAQQTKIQVISNNLANSGTTAFKKGRAVFEDLLYQTVRQPGGQASQNNELPSGLMLGTGVRTVATQKTFTVGGIIQTDNALDMAINGRGFFQLIEDDGTFSYTRNGQFALNNAGIIVNANGQPLQPNITIPDGALSVTIGTDGTVSVLETGNTAPTQVGTIQLVDFINPGGLQPIGANKFNETIASGAPQIADPGTDGLGELKQQAIETSNVNVVEELVALIEAQRGFEMNAKVIEAVDSSLQFVSQQL